MFPGLTKTVLYHKVWACSQPPPCAAFCFLSCLHPCPTHPGAAARTPAWSPQGTAGLEAAAKHNSEWRPSRTCRLTNPARNKDGGVGTAPARHRSTLPRPPLWLVPRATTWRFQPRRAGPARREGTRPRRGRAGHQVTTLASPTATGVTLVEGGGRWGRDRPLAAGPAEPSCSSLRGRCPCGAAAAKGARAFGRTPGSAARKRAGRCAVGGTGAGDVRNGGDCRPRSGHWHRTAVTGGGVSWRVLHVGSGGSGCARCVSGARFPNSVKPHGIILVRQRGRTDPVEINNGPELLSRWAGVRLRLQVITSHSSSVGACGVVAVVICPSTMNLQRGSLAVTFWSLRLKPSATSPASQWWWSHQSFWNTSVVFRDHCRPCCRNCEFWKASQHGRGFEGWQVCYSHIKLSFHIVCFIPKVKAVPSVLGETVTSDIKHKDTDTQRMTVVLVLIQLSFSIKDLLPHWWLGPNSHRMDPWLFHRHWRDFVNPGGELGSWHRWYFCSVKGPVSAEHPSAVQCRSGGREEAGHWRYCLPLLKFSRTKLLTKPWLLC